MKLLILITIGLNIVGCSHVSTAPSVSNPDKKGNYLVVVNKQKSILGFNYHNLNVVMKCNYSGKKCKELILVDKNGNSFK